MVIISYYRNSFIINSTLIIWQKNLLEKLLSRKIVKSLLVSKGNMLEGTTSSKEYLGWLAKNFDEWDMLIC